MTEIKTINQEIVERLYDRLLQIEKVKPTEAFRVAHDFVLTELRKIAGQEPVNPQLLYDLELPF